MIGDRFETDILGAIHAGINPLVVNTGVAATRSKPNIDSNGVEYPLIENLKQMFDLLQ